MTFGVICFRHVKRPLWSLGPAIKLPATASLYHRNWQNVSFLGKPSYSLAPSVHKSPYLSKRKFSWTSTRHRDHHFDTLRFVSRLRQEGFTEEQAVSLMKVLSDVIEERYENLEKHEFDLDFNRQYSCIG